MGAGQGQGGAAVETEFGAVRIGRLAGRAVHELSPGVKRLANLAGGHGVGRSIGLLVMHYYCTIVKRVEGTNYDSMLAGSIITPERGWRPTREEFCHYTV